MTGSKCEVCAGTGKCNWLGTLLDCPYCNKETENTSPRDGVVIGRFQVPFLHEGHKHLIDSAIRECGVVLIIIGVAKTIDENNPLNYGTRYEIIRDEYPDVFISAITDRESDEEWSIEVDKIAKRFQLDNPHLYGSRKSFIDNYKGILPYVAVPEIPGVSGTKIREELRNESKETVGSNEENAREGDRHPEEQSA